MQLLRVVVLALAAWASTASANLTPYTTSYDGTIVYVKTSLVEIAAVVAAQNNAWLSDKFAALGQDIDAAIVGGQLSYANYMNLLRGFDATAETKVPKFTEMVNARLENSAINFAEYNAAAPASWCDYVFATFTDLAETSNRKSLRELVVATRSAVEEQINNNASASAINDRMKTFYQQANTFDSSVVASFDAKVAAFLDSTVSPEKSTASESQGTSTSVAPTTASNALATNRVTVLTMLLVVCSTLLLLV